MSSLKRLSPDELDERTRAVERAAYEDHGLAPDERTVSLRSPLGPVEMRLVVFGPAGPQPPVLLLHGIASVNVLAAPLIAALGARQVIAVDWLGHGLSTPSVLPPGLAFRSYTTSVLRSLLDALGLDRADVVGHSMGAQFGLYAGLDLPDRVRRLVLLGAPGASLEGVRPNPAMVALAVPRLGARLLRIRMSPEAFVRNTERALGEAALRDVPANVLSAAHLIAMRPGSAESIASYFRALIRRATIRRAVTIAPTELALLLQPTLFLWGDRDTFMRPAEAAPHISSMPNARLVQLPAAGHAPWLQHPGAVTAEMVRHLAAS
jgi:pimeloyl-ACP methyl ester carboxylesterase